MRTANWIFLGALAVLAGVLLYWMRDFPTADITQGFGPAFYPLLLVGVLVLLMVVLAIRTWRVKVPAEQKEADTAAEDKVDLKKPALMVAAMVVYALLLDQIGFLATSVLYLGFTMKILGVGWKRMALTSVATVALIYVIFAFGFKVPLPDGVLFGG